MTRHRLLTAALLWIAAFTAFAAWLWCSCRYTLWYKEGLATFCFNANALRGLPARTGAAELFLRQFFVSPAAAVAVSAGVLATVSVLTGALMCRIAGSRLLMAAACIPAVLVAANVCSVDRDTEIINGITAYAAEGRWDMVEKLTADAPLDDIRVQNLLNLALAEEGTLADRIFEKPCFGPESLLMHMTTPEAFAILSDVYWSMGLVSASQCFAFQANEAYGDFSPRMLRRLADISLVCGEYDVADKYLSILESTLFHRGWARERRRLIGDDRAVSEHPELGPKRACLFPDNRFMASRGIDDDLRQVLRANPRHTPTLQYLGCLYLLSRDMPRFMRMLDECRGALPSPLPRHFQEAVCAAAIASHQRLDLEYGVPPAVMEACWDFWTNGTPQPGTCWQYMKEAIQ